MTLNKCRNEGNMNRTERINEEIKKAISNIISNDIKDPRIPLIISITDVRTTKDLKFADVYFSIFGDETARVSTLAALKSAAGFIRRELSRKVELRFTPELRFKEDRSIEKAIEMSAKINKIVKKDEG